MTKKTIKRRFHRGGETQWQEIMRKVNNGPDASDIAFEKKQKAVISRLRRVTASKQLPCRRFCDAYYADEEEDLEKMFPGGKKRKQERERKLTAAQRKAKKEDLYNTCAIEFCDDKCEMTRFHKELNANKTEPAFNKKYTKRMIAFMKQKGASSGCSQNDAWIRIMKSKYN